MVEEKTFVEATPRSSPTPTWMTASLSLATVDSASLTTATVSTDPPCLVLLIRLGPLFCDHGVGTDLGDTCIGTSDVDIAGQLRHLNPAARVARV